MLIARKKHSRRLDYRSRCFAFLSHPLPALARTALCAGSLILYADMELLSELRAIALIINLLLVWFPFPPTTPFPSWFQQWDILSVESFWGQRKEKE